MVHSGTLVVAGSLHLKPIRRKYAPNCGALEAAFEARPSICITQVRVHLMAENPRALFYLGGNASSANASQICEDRIGRINHTRSGRGSWTRRFPPVHLMSAATGSSILPFSKNYCVASEGVSGHQRDLGAVLEEHVNSRLESGSSGTRKQKAGTRKQEPGSRKQEAGTRKQEAGSGAPWSSWLSDSPASSPTSQIDTFPLLCGTRARPRARALQLTARVHVGTVQTPLTAHFPGSEH